MSYLYQKCKNIWGSPTSFWRHVIWKCMLILRNRSSSFDTTSAVFGAKMLWMNHWKQACIAGVYLGRCIKRIYSTFEVPWGKSNLKQLHFQTRRASKCAEFDCVGVKKGEKINFQHWFFVHILTIGRNLSKKVMCPKKSGGHRPH